MDSFGAQNPPSVPSRLITISAEQGTNTVTQLKYCVPLRGINPDDIELYLIRSLEDGKYYFILCICTCLFFYDSVNYNIGGQ